MGECKIEKGEGGGREGGRREREKWGEQRGTKDKWEEMRVGRKKGEARWKESQVATLTTHLTFPYR